MSRDFDQRRRRFLTTTATVVGGGGLVAAAVPFLTSLQPSARARIASGPVDVDISDLRKGGARRTVKWRGRPVVVLYRTPEMIGELRENDPQLRDPKSLKAQQPEFARNEYRSLRPEYLVLLAQCTHFGCVPIYLAAGAEHNLGEDWNGGFYCPCHRSRFDLAGRVYKGVPAQLNLEVPLYRFSGEQKLIIGEEAV